MTWKLWIASLGPEFQIDLVKKLVQLCPAVVTFFNMTYFAAITNKVTLSCTLLSRMRSSFSGIHSRVGKYFGFEGSYFYLWETARTRATSIGELTGFTFHFCQLLQHWLRDILEWLHGFFEKMWLKLRGKARSPCWLGSHQFHACIITTWGYCACSCLWLQWKSFILLKKNLSQGVRSHSSLKLCIMDVVDPKVLLWSKMSFPWTRQKRVICFLLRMTYILFFVLPLNPCSRIQGPSKLEHWYVEQYIFFKKNLSNHEFSSKIWKNGSF